MTPSVAARLSEVIQRMNDLFEGELSEADFVNFANHVRDKLVENPALRRQARVNSKEQFALGDFQEALRRATLATRANHASMATQVLTNTRTRDGFAALLLDMVWEALREGEITSP